MAILLYINDFEATRRFLEALKTAGDSGDLPLQDPKMWSTFVDLQATKNVTLGISRV